MTLIDWRGIPRTCFCGKTFMPKSWNNNYCCRGHQRIYDIAGRTKLGRKLLKEDPQAVLKWYAHLL